MEGRIFVSEVPLYSTVGWFVTVVVWLAESNPPNPWIAGSNHIDPSIPRVPAIQPRHRIVFAEINLFGTQIISQISRGIGAVSYFRSHESRSHSETKGQYLRVERGGLWEGCRESRRCSRDTYQESYIAKYTSIRR